jgi:hypothetical protein
MDTKSNQKTRHFTKFAWCKKRKDDSCKKARSRSKETGEVGTTRTVSANPPETRKVAPEFGAWFLAAAVLAAVLIMVT